MGLKDLPLANGKTHVKVFKALGWVLRCCSKNNHFILTHSDHRGIYTSIPDHKEVKKQTLKGILRDAGIGDKEYRKVFDKHS